MQGLHSRLAGALRLARSRSATTWAQATRERAALLLASGRRALDALRGSAAAPLNASALVAPSASGGAFGAARTAVGALAKAGGAVSTATGSAVRAVSTATGATVSSAVGGVSSAGGAAAAGVKAAASAAGAAGVAALAGVAGAAGVAGGAGQAFAQRTLLYSLAFVATASFAYGVGTATPESLRRFFQPPLAAPDGARERGQQ